jgi:hypothetical protein
MNQTCINTLFTKSRMIYIYNMKWNNKIDCNKIIMSTKNNLIIIINNVK